MRLLIRSAKQVVRVSNKRENFKTKDEMSDVAILEAHNGEGISIAVDRFGRIAAVDRDSVVENLYKDADWEKILDATGKCVIPGLVDAHTHPVWAGDRVHEFVMKLSGASYLEVHNAGGGIHFTVEKTREATEEDLIQSFEERLQRMKKTGTTTVECKSGYGLNLETELKMLRVIEAASKKAKTKMTLVSTYCGAHAVAKGMTVTEATEDVVHVQLPEIKRLVETGEISTRNVDVFCEKGVFGVDETRKILQCAKSMGFLLNFHAEELSNIGGAELGASLGAEAMSHLEEVSDAALDAMAEEGCVAVILPTTAFFLRLPHPPVRKMIEKGVAVALGTDFNPNAHCTSMPLVMHLSCVLFRTSPNEALVAATLNSARSLRLENDIGSIEVGKWADLVIVDAPRWEHLIYQLGGETNTISEVIYHGQMLNRT